ncbi:MAG: hypothetical protein VB997_02925 [Opitutales bacterium]
MDGVPDLGYDLVVFLRLDGHGDLEEKWFVLVMTKKGGKVSFETGSSTGKAWNKRS